MGKRREETDLRKADTQQATGPVFFWLQCRIAQNSCGHIHASTVQKSVNIAACRRKQTKAQRPNKTKPPPKKQAASRRT